VTIFWEVLQCEAPVRLKIVFESCSESAVRRSEGVVCWRDSFSLSMRCDVNRAAETGSY